MEENHFIRQPSDPSPPGNTGGEQVVYPPRPELDEKSPNAWLKSILSLALYLLFGLFVFQDHWQILLIITGIVIFHEMGHFLAMKFFDYKELGIFFIPLLGAYAAGTKHEVSQRQSIIILLAGPLPGIALGILLHVINQSYHDTIISNASTLLIFLNLLNLLPIYPLDGGQILNRLFMDESNLISRTFIVLSAGAMVWFAYKLFFPSFIFYLLLYFPLSVLLRLKNEISNDKIIKRIEQEGSDLNKDYEDISDKEYWEIRNALIKHHPDLKDIPPAPPYRYAPREDKVIATMQGLLQRLIIMDLSVIEKIMIILLWTGCFISPFLMEMSIDFFQIR